MLYQVPSPNPLEFVANEFAPPCRAFKSSGVFQSLEITLSTAIVVPLLDLIRETATDYEDQREAGPKERAHVSDADVLRMRATPRELETLLALFNPDFPRTGVIRVDATDVTNVVRACALLRLRLRRTRFAHVSDAEIESGDALDPERCPGEAKSAVMCYLFLATLQETILQSKNMWQASGSWWRRVADAVKAFLGPRPPTWTTEAKPPALGVDRSPVERWRVVVLNDPVNLMSYVSMAFQIVIGLPPDAAALRMREVHEQQRSIVWKGTEKEAAEKMRALHVWHLTAVIERDVD